MISSISKNFCRDADSFSAKAAASPATVGDVTAGEALADDGAALKVGNGAGAAVAGGAAPNVKGEAAAGAAPNVSGCWDSTAGALANTGAEATAGNDAGTLGCAAANWGAGGKSGWPAGVAGANVGVTWGAIPLVEATGSGGGLVTVAKFQVGSAAGVVSAAAANVTGASGVVDLAGSLDGGAENKTGGCDIAVDDVGTSGVRKRLGALCQPTEVGTACDSSVPSCKLSEAGALAPDTENTGGSGIAFI